MALVNCPYRKFLLNYSWKLDTVSYYEAGFWDTSSDPIKTNERDLDRKITKEDSIHNDLWIMS